MIVTTGVTKRVPTSEGELTILQPIQMEVKTGESIAIVGASGSGKSTLLGLLAGLDSASSGEIWLHQHPLHALDEEARAQVRGRHVGFIFQSFMLVQSLTALENVMLPAQLAGMADPRGKAQAILDRVGLGHRHKHFPNQLSGGEQQRVAIARAFITEPEVLFADEPTGNLDADNGERVADLLFELNQNAHTTLVLVTHDPRLAARCDRQLHMQGGRLTQQLVKPHLVGSVV